MNEPSRSQTEVSEALLHPANLWRGDELWKSPESPPAKAGVYAWYFDRAPGCTPLDGCQSYDKRWLLYVGISPSSVGSKAQLRTRLRQHFRGNARGSTLRKTLGCLLQAELELDFGFHSPNSARFSKECEAKLSEWINEHARVAWVTNPEPWVVEEQMISGLSLPLNLQGNQRHPFYAQLKLARAEMLQAARSNLDGTR